MAIEQDNIRLVPISLQHMQQSLAHFKVIRFRRFYNQLMLYIVCMSVLYLLYYVGPSNIKFNSAYSIHEIPILWGFCLVIRLLFLYFDRIPVLKRWQDNLVERYLNTYKNSFEIQYLKQHQ